MGEIEDAIQRADQDVFTRQPPKNLKARINFLVGRLKTTKAVAAELGVSQRSVERYRTGERRHPPKPIADRIDAAVRARWQPKVRRRHRKQAATATGITVETRARFGYTAPIGTTDDGRMRRLTVHLPRPTPTACSTHNSTVPPTSRCGTSSPKDCRRCTSRTADTAPQASKSPSPTSTTSTSPTDRATAPAFSSPGEPKHEGRRRPRCRAHPDAGLRPRPADREGPPDPGGHPLVGKPPRPPRPWPGTRHQPLPDTSPARFRKPQHPRTAAPPGSSGPRPGDEQTDCPPQHLGHRDRSPGSQARSIARTQTPGPGGPALTRADGT